MKTFNKIKSWLLVALVATGAGLSFTACDDDDSVYSYANQLHSFGPSPASRGETIRFIGSGLNEVSKIIFPVDVEVTDFVSKTSEEIVVTVPQEAVPGRIRLIIGSKEIVTKSIITFSEPITVESVTTPNEVLTAGDEIVVTGEYLYNVASVTFGNNAEVTTEAFTKQERHELRLKVPAEAKTGKITFSDGDMWTYTTEKEYEVRTASVTALSKSALTEGEQFTITGENLQLVKRVIFPGDLESEFTVNADGTMLTTTVPVGTCSGVIDLELYSLDRIATPEFTVPTIEITGISPRFDIVPGLKLTVTGKLLNLVSRIEFPGGEIISSGWDVSADGNTLTVAAPASIVDGKITFVQNDNIKVISEGISTLKNGNTFWTGNFAFGNWGKNLEINKELDHDLWAAFSETITAPGTLTITFAQDAAAQWWQIQPRYRSNWDIAFASVRDNNSGIIETEKGQTSVQIRLTQEDIDQLNGDGWAFSGCNMTLTQMEYENPNAPKVFLTLNYDISAEDDWSNLEISAQSDEDNGVTFYESFCRAINAPGTLVINIERYSVIPEEEECQMELRYLYNGWKEHFSAAPEVLTVEPGTRSITLHIDQNDVDALHGNGKYATFTNKKGETRPCDPWEKGWAISGKFFILKSFAFKAD